MSVWTILSIVSNIDLIRNLKASGGSSGIQTHDLPAVFESRWSHLNFSFEIYPLRIAWVWWGRLKSWRSGSQKRPLLEETYHASSRSSSLWAPRWPQSGLFASRSCCWKKPCRQQGNERSDFSFRAKQTSWSRVSLEFVVWTCRFSGSLSLRQSKHKDFDI